MSTRKTKELSSNADKYVKSFLGGISVKIDSISTTKSVIYTEAKPATERTDTTKHIDNTEVIISQSKHDQSTGSSPTDFKEDEMNEDLLNLAIEQANKSLKGYDRVIERNIHEKTKAMMYVIKDSKTHEIIAEFPPKKIQDMIAKMWELAGLFVDEKA